MVAGRLLVVQGRFEMLIDCRCNRRQWPRRIKRRRLRRCLRGARAIGLVGMVLRSKPVAARRHRLMCCMRIIFANLVMPRSLDVARSRLGVMARRSPMLESGQILFRHSISSKIDSACDAASRPAVLAQGGALASIRGRRSRILLVGLCGLMVRLLAMLQRLLRALPCLFHLAVSLAFDGLLMLLGRHFMVLCGSGMGAGIGGDTRTSRDGG